MIYTTEEHILLTTLESKIELYEIYLTKAKCRVRQTRGHDQEALDELKVLSTQMLALLKEYNEALNKQSSPINQS